MAKSTLERKRESLARKALEANSRVDLTQPYQKSSFSDFYQEHDLDVQMALDIAGLNPDLDLEDDQRDPRSFTGEIENGDPDNETYRGYPGAIGRAEITVGSLLDAATAIARIINDYKKRELEAEEARLHALADEVNSDERRNILAQLVKINRMADDLEKRVRWTIPQWKLKGD